MCLTVLSLGRLCLCCFCKYFTLWCSHWIVLNLQMNSQENKRFTDTFSDRTGRLYSNRKICDGNLRWLRRNRKIKWLKYMKILYIYRIYFVHDKPIVCTCTYYFAKEFAFVKSFLCLAPCPLRTHPNFLNPTYCICWITPVIHILFGR